MRFPSNLRYSYVAFHLSLFNEQIAQSLPLLTALHQRVAIPRSIAFRAPTAEHIRNGPIGNPPQTRMQGNARACSYLHIAHRYRFPPRAYSSERTSKLSSNCIRTADVLGLIRVVKIGEDVDVQ